MELRINPLVGLRLAALREERKLKQSDVARVIGVKSHQIVSKIESGERPMSGSEMAAIVDTYGITPDYLTDPFRLIGEGQFCWRQTHCSAEVLNSYQLQAGRWLAAYRALSRPEERPGPRERMSLRLWERSQYELAEAEGERFTVDYKMGDVPAKRLPEVMEKDFGILVLMVDSDERISGAACRLPELDAVLVNRNENPGRRNFDLAHEFFHLLTWDQMPPSEIEEVTESGGSRVERLANAFASALLMPKRVLARWGDWQKLGNAERATRMREVADFFRVSVSALHWRLVGLRLLFRNSEMLDVEAPSADYLADTPAAFSPTFMRVMSDAIDRGEISVARLAKLIQVPRHALRDLFTANNVAAPVTV